MQPWRVVTTRPLFDRPPWMSLWEEDVLLPQGVVIQGYLRATGRDYAMVFAVQADGTVPLVRQYKHGIGSLSYDLPAGYLDAPTEPPLAAAQRELREETGLVAAHWRELGHLVIDTNRGDTQAHLYLALNASPEGPQDLDPEESLEVSYHRPDELRRMVMQGAINSMASVAGIMLALAALDDERSGSAPSSRR